jgi:hypothetical protein
MAHLVSLKMYSDAQSSSCIIEQCLWKGDLAAAITKEILKTADIWNVVTNILMKHSASIFKFEE